MNERTRRFLDRALDTIEVAESILDMNKPEMAAGRAYYAMFYVAEALLAEKGLEFSQHGQVIGTYGKVYAKTKELDPKFHRWLVDAFNVSITADYDVDESVSVQIVNTLMSQAREFLEAAQKYLENPKA
jgi:uncharacterized protein (UPF0332 family)